MKNIIKLSLCLLTCVLARSLQAASIKTVSPSDSPKAKAMVSMATIPATTYGEDSNIY